MHEFDATTENILNIALYVHIHVSAYVGYITIFLRFFFQILFKKNVYNIQSIAHLSCNIFPSF